MSKEDWIKEHPDDYRMIRGEMPISKLEYKYIMEELELQGFTDLIEMLEKQKENLLQRK